MIQDWPTGSLVARICLAFWGFLRSHWKSPVPKETTYFVHVKICLKTCTNKKTIPRPTQLTTKKRDKKRSKPYTNNTKHISLQSNQFSWALVLQLKWPKITPWHRDALAAWFWASNSSIWVSWQVPSPFHHLPWCSRVTAGCRWIAAKLCFARVPFCTGGEFFEPTKKSEEDEMMKVFCGKTWGLHDLNPNAMVNEKLKCFKEISMNNKSYKADDISRQT